MIQININHTKVNQLDRFVTISLSQSHMTDRFSNDKRNQGFGQIYGERNKLIKTIQLIDDADVIDSVSQKLTRYKSSD